MARAGRGASAKRKRRPRAPITPPIDVMPHDRHSIVFPPARVRLMPVRPPMRMPRGSGRRSGLSRAMQRLESEHERFM